MSAAPANDGLLRALLREPVDRTPVWIMRQAGRYLPEYRATRARAGDFMTLCTTPELACEVTLQPVTRFALDAAILFSDILTVPDAMGLGLHFLEGEGPRFRKTVRSAADVRALRAPDPETDLRYVMDAVRLIRRELDGRVPLIGFAGSPWTVATYMIEGGGSKDLTRARGMLYAEPALAHDLLALLAQTITAYLNAQIAADAQAVMIFDTWGGVLTTAAYREYSLRYMEQVVDGLTRVSGGRRVPSILFTKGGAQWLEAIAATGCDAVGVDWTIDIGAARLRVGDRVALQGNLDPCALHAPPEQLRAQVASLLASYGRGSGHARIVRPLVSSAFCQLIVRVTLDGARDFVKTCGSRQKRTRGARRERAEKAPLGPPGPRAPRALSRTPDALGRKTQAPPL